MSCPSATGGIWGGTILPVVPPQDTRKDVSAESYGSWMVEDSPEDCSMEVKVYLRLLHIFKGLYTTGTSSTSQKESRHQRKDGQCSEESVVIYKGWLPTIS